MPSTTIGCQCLASEFVGRHHKHTIGFWVWYVNDSQVSPGKGLSQGDTGIIPPGPILTWLFQYILNLIFLDTMPIDMRHSSAGIEVKAYLHPLNINYIRFRANTTLKGASFEILKAEGVEKGGPLQA